MEPADEPESPTPATPASVAAAVQNMMDEERSLESDSDDTSESASSDSDIDEPGVPLQKPQTSLFNPTTVFVGAYAIVRREDQHAACLNLRVCMLWLPRGLERQVTC